MFKVRSPMLVAVGMYLPFPTTCAIFVGGMLRWFTDWRSRAAGINEAQRTRVENVGILVASGLIAGEALTGLLFAYFKFKDIAVFEIFKDPSYLAGFAVILLLAFVMVRVRCRKPDGRKIRLPRGNDVTERFWEAEETAASPIRRVGARRLAGISIRQNYINSRHQVKLGSERISVGIWHGIHLYAEN